VVVLFKAIPVLQLVDGVLLVRLERHVGRVQRGGEEEEERRKNVTQGCSETLGDLPNYPMRALRSQQSR